MNTDRRMAPPPAKLVMRLRQVIRQPVLTCRAVLSAFPPEKQERYIRFYEENRVREVRHQFELAPEYKAVDAEVREEALAIARAYLERREAKLRAMGRQGEEYVARGEFILIYDILRSCLLVERYDSDATTPV